jgi:hypothetical protein
VGRSTYPDEGPGRNAKSQSCEFSLNPSLTPEPVFSGHPADEHLKFPVELAVYRFSGGKLFGFIWCAIAGLSRSRAALQAETKSLGRQTDLSMRYPRHDCEGRSSSLATVGAFSGPE